jgi:negative regulator of flagellin synthesis FlgM
MKIADSTPHYINQAYTNSANTAANQTLKSQKTADPVVNEIRTDSISFSDRTKDLQKISKAMETDPVDRKNYVADIKSKVETGQYTMNAETVAEKMVGFVLNGLG